MTSHSLFIPISKVDAKKRLVYGRLSEEVADKSGEILDYESSKAAFQKWSDDQFEASGGKSKGNLRAMHDNIAAGKFTDISFDDANKSIEGVAKVVDEDSWNKVLEGVFTGFSIGGGYAKRWTDPDQPHLKRYTPTLAEVSLVDNPCVPTATFEFIKEDGSTELRKFNHREDTMTKTTTKTGEKDQPTVTDAAEDAVQKAAGDEKPAGGEVAEAQATATDAQDDAPAEPAVAKQAPADGESTAQRPQDKGGVVQGFQAKDGSFHLKKSDALARNSEVDAEQVAAPAMEALKKLSDAVTKAEGGEEEPKAEKADDADDAEKAAKPADDDDADAKPAADDAEKAAPAEELKKGMYDVSRFADLLQSIRFLQQDTQWEAEWEGDNSELPAKLKVWLAEGGALLVQMVTEETAELTADKAANADDLAKKGAKISAASKEHIAKMRKSARAHVDAMEESCKALGLDDEGEGDDAAKMTKRDDDALQIENKALKKAFGEMTPKLEGLLKKFEEQNERIAHLEKQPMPAKGALRVVEKGNDGGNVSDGDEVKKLQELTKGKTPEEVSMLLMKAALNNPRPAI